MKYLNKNTHFFSKNINSLKEHRFILQQAPELPWYNPKSWITPDKPGEAKLLDPTTWFSAPEWVGKLGAGLGEFLTAFGTLLGTVNKVFVTATDFLDWSVSSTKDLVKFCKDKYHGKPKELPFYKDYKNAMLRSYVTEDDDVTPVNPPRIEATVQRGSPRANMVLSYDVRLACIQYRLNQLRLYYAPVVDTVTKLKDMKEQMKSSQGRERRTLGEDIALEQRQSKRDKRDTRLNRRLDQNKKLVELESFSDDGTAPLPMPQYGKMTRPDGTEDKKRFFAGPGTADVYVIGYLKEITPILNRYQKEVSELEEEVYKLGYYKGEMLAEIKSDIDKGDAGKKAAAQAEAALIESNESIIKKRLGTNNVLYEKEFIKTAKDVTPKTPAFNLFKYR